MYGYNDYMALHELHFTDMKHYGTSFFEHLDPLLKYYQAFGEQFRGYYPLPRYGHNRIIGMPNPGNYPDI